MIKRLRHTLLVALLAAVAFACKDSWYDGADGGLVPSTRARFSASVATGETLVINGGRSLTSGEKVLKNITLVFFKKDEATKTWKYLSYATAPSASIKTEVKDDKEYINFEADVPKEVEVITHVFGNVDFSRIRPDGENFFEWAKDKDVNTVTRQVVDDVPLNELDSDGNEQAQTLMMWGYQGPTVFETDAGGNVINGVNDLTLVRDVAKVSVVLSDDVKQKADFHLLEMKMYNVPNEAQVVPYINETDGDYPEDYPKSKNPLEEIGTPREPDQISLANYATADHTPADDSYKFTRDHDDIRQLADLEDQTESYTLYIHPVKNTKKEYVSLAGETVQVDRNNRAYCILKGIYWYDNEWQVGYYRVDVADVQYDETGKKLTKFQLYDLIRRYNYHFYLRTVTGPGYETEEEAKQAPMSNLIIMDVVTTPNEGVTDVISNGQYRMGLTNRETYYYKGTGTDPEANGWAEGCLKLSDVYLYSLLTEDNINSGTADGVDLGSVPKDEMAATVPTLKKKINGSDPGCVKIVELTEGTGTQGGDIIDKSYNQNGYQNGLKFEYHTDDANPQNWHVSIYIRRRALDDSETDYRMRTLRITAGNLKRDLIIFQGEKGNFQFFKAVAEDGTPNFSAGHEALTSNENGELYPTYYISWEPKQRLRIPIQISKKAIIPSSGVKCKLNLSYGGTVGFMSYQNTTSTGLITFDSKTRQTVLELNSTAGFYSTQINVYRINRIALTAKGMNDGIFLVKQSKYLDGVTGEAVVAVIRDDDDTDAYTLNFGNVEQDWSATVENGTGAVDWLKLSAADGDANAYVSADKTEVTSKGTMMFKYQMAHNGTGVNRYCKIVLRYGDLREGTVTATHTIYVQQGFKDIEIPKVHLTEGSEVNFKWNGLNIKGAGWMVHNVTPGTFRKGRNAYDLHVDGYKSNPGEPGVMFHFDNDSIRYYGGGGWGKTYSDAISSLAVTPGNSTSIKSKLEAFYAPGWMAGGSRCVPYADKDNTVWADWGEGVKANNYQGVLPDRSPCPKGYHVADFYQWFTMAFELKGEKYTNKLSESWMDNKVKMLAARFFTHAYWGRVTDGSTAEYRPGVLLVKEETNGAITRMLFFPGAGVRSHNFAPRQWENKYWYNGSLLTIHWKEINESRPEFQFSNQGGYYWGQNPQLKVKAENGVLKRDGNGNDPVASVELYHDDRDNIGILPKQWFFQASGGQTGYWHSINDACPVRCVRDL